MPYKDKEKVKEAMQRFRDKRKGITPGITKEAGITKGITSLDTPQDVKAVLTAALGKWHPIDEWTPAEIAAHQAKIRKQWGTTGNWNAAYCDLAPKMGWGKR